MTEEKALRSDPTPTTAISTGRVLAAIRWRRGANAQPLSFADRLLAVGDADAAVRELCAVRFKDFQFGLQLICKNTGHQEFTIDADAVDAPDKILSEWVVRSYRGAPAAASSP